jgi:sulfofructose kinase
MTELFDILGLGCVSVDDFLYVDSFPAADEKLAARHGERQCGGLTATAMVAASRLGAKCAFCGVLGNDELSEFVAETLRSENVDVSYAPRLPEARPVHSTIVVGARGNTRNIFFEVGGLSGAHDSKPDAAIIQSARVLFVDHLGVTGSIRACRIAREAGMAVVADLERETSAEFQTLLGLVDHLILSKQFALKLTGCGDAEAAIAALWTCERKLVAVTNGDRGCWYRSTDSPAPVHFPAYAVEVVDSTGCGDVFHGAYAASLAAGATVEERIRFASASAALKATKAGGQAGIPNRNAVEAFLRERP